MAGKDQQNSAEFNAKLAVREQRYHRQHHAGKETEHRNGLKNIEQGDHETFGAPVVSGDIAVDQSKGQAQYVGDADPQHGEQRIHRQRVRAQIDFNLGRKRSAPIAGQHHHAVKQRQTKSEDGDIGEQRPVGTRKRQPGQTKRP